MAEHGLLCATCTRQTLHRREEPSHVLWAILTLFSCGEFWSVQCVNGPAFQVQVKPDDSTSVLECRLYERATRGKCFVRF